MGRVSTLHPAGDDRPDEDDDRRFEASLGERSAKAQVVALVEDLPADSTYDEILRELAFHRMTERGLSDADRERVLTTDDLRHEMSTWPG